MMNGMVWGFDNCVQRTTTIAILWNSSGDGAPRQGVLCECLHHECNAINIWTTLFRLTWKSFQPEKGSTGYDDDDGSIAIQGSLETQNRAPGQMVRHLQKSQNIKETTGFICIHTHSRVSILSSSLRPYLDPWQRSRIWIEYQTKPRSCAFSG